MHPSAAASDIETDLAAQLESTDLPQACVAVSVATVNAAAEIKLREVRELPEYEH